MRTRFDWQVGNDDGQWETIAQTGGDTPRARRHRALQWIGMVSLCQSFSVEKTFLLAKVIDIMG